MVEAGGWGASGRRGAGTASKAPFCGVITGFGAGGSLSDSCTRSGFGVSSIVECLPVVHGGIDKNSSKVRTRGLQHFQPLTRVSLCTCNFEEMGHADTFLSLVENGRSWMKHAFFFNICIRLAAAFVNAFLRHVVHIARCR